MLDIEKLKNETKELTDKKIDRLIQMVLSKYSKDHLFKRNVLLSKCNCNACKLLRRYVRLKIDIRNLDKDYQICDKDFDDKIKIKNCYQEKIDSIKPLIEKLKENN